MPTEGSTLLLGLATRRKSTVFVDTGAGASGGIPGTARWTGHSRRR